jgi:hypothetical protein
MSNGEADSTFKVLGVSLKANVGFFEFIEGFAIAVFGLWPVTLLLELTESI